MDADWRALLETKLKLQEGTRSKPYQDSVGILTIGVGHNLNKGLRPDEIALIFKNDVSEALADCAKLPYWEQLPNSVQYAVANLVFNMGLEKWAEFKNSQADLAAGRYAEAAARLRKSKWYGQVGAARGEDVCRAIEKGVG